MDVTERSHCDRRRLARLVDKEPDAMQRDRLRSVLLALEGRETLEVAGTVGRSRAFVQRLVYMYRDGGIAVARGRTASGRKRRLSPDQEARLVQRLKAGAAPRPRTMSGAGTSCSTGRRALAS
jgi:transposase